MDTTTLTSRLTRSAAGILSAVLLASPLVLAAAASASIPDGSLGEVIIETGDATGQPYNAILSGWWGHEGASGPTGKGATFPSLDASDGKGVVDDKTYAALHKKFEDGGDFSSLRVAFVPYSADGSNERPRVTKGETVGRAFTWFADMGFGTSLNGTTNKNDAVQMISTADQYTKWWNAGRPLEGFDNQLKVLDIASNGSSKPAVNPQGTSILDRWPAGTKISMVFYVSAGVDKAMPLLPTVKVGPDGRALTAWMTFETVADPTSGLRTSAGYKVLTGAGTGPGAAAKPRVGPGTGQTADPQSSASSGPAAAGATSGSSNASGQKSADSGFMSSVPGGQPVFWIVIALLIAGGVVGITLRMRTASMP